MTSKYILIQFPTFQNLEAELSKKCDELRQLFMLQQQSNNNHEDMSSAVASPTSSSPPASTSLTSRSTLRKADDEDSNSSLIVNNFSEDSSMVNLCFSKEIETLRSQLKTQVSKIENIIFSSS